MSYSITVGIQGKDAQIESLRQMFEEAVIGKCSNKDINSFFKKIGIVRNPLIKGGKDFSVSEDDSKNKVEIDDPEPFFSSISKAFPEMEFFFIGFQNTDEGNGVDYYVYRDNELIESDTNFYYGNNCGGYQLTRIPEEALADFIKAKYALWQIKDSGKKKEISEAQEKEEKARNNWQEIHNFLLDGGIDFFKTARRAFDFSNMNRGSFDHELKMISLFDDAGGYKGITIADIEKIDFRGNKKLSTLPDLSGYTGLKKLIIAKTTVKELPEYLNKRIKDGKLKVFDDSNIKDADNEQEEWIDKVSDAWERNVYNVIKEAPEKYRTYKFYLAAVKNFPLVLDEVPMDFRDNALCLIAASAEISSGFVNCVMEYVPEDVINEEISLAAASRQDKSLKFIPERFRTKEVCLAHIENFPESSYLEYIPASLWEEKDFCIDGINKNWRIIGSIPENSLTAQMCLLAVKVMAKEGAKKKYDQERAIGFQLFKFYKMPEKFITEEICLIAIENDPRAIEYIPDIFKSHKVCELAAYNKVVKDIYFEGVLKFIPDEFKTKELCFAAIANDKENSANSLIYVPEQFITKEICQDVFDQDYRNLEFLPDKYKTKEMCLAVIQKIKETGGDGSVESAVVKFIPENLLTSEMCIAAAEASVFTLQYIPDLLKTDEVCVPAIQNNTRALTYIPEKLLTPVMCLAAVTKRGSALEDIPSKMRTKEVCIKALSHGKKIPEILKKVPKKILEEVKNEAGIK